jgi:hypothetical protein
MIRTINQNQNTNDYESSFYVKTSTSLPRNCYVTPSDEIIGKVEECKEEFVIDPITHQIIRNPKIIGRLSTDAHPYGADKDEVVLIVGDLI